MTESEGGGRLLSIPLVLHAGEGFPADVLSAGSSVSGEGKRQGVGWLEDIQQSREFTGPGDPAPLDRVERREAHPQGIKAAAIARQLKRAEGDDTPTFPATFGALAFESPPVPR